MQDLRDLRMQVYANRMQQNREYNVNVRVVIKHKKEKRPKKEPVTYVPERRVHLKRIAESPPPAYNFYQRLLPHYTDRQLKYDQQEQKHWEEVEKEEAQEHEQMLKRRRKEHKIERKARLTEEQELR